MVVSTLSLLGLATVRATLLNFGRHLLGYLYSELRGAFLELSSTNEASDDTRRKIPALEEYQA
jgi:hypothetical protein